MKTKFTTVLFDLDGTLLNSLADLAASVNYILEENGYPTRTADEVRSFIGNGIGKLVERALPVGTPEVEVARLVADFAAYYQTHMQDATAPYAGILPMLDTLLAAGCKLGVVSNKIDSAVKALCARYFGERLSAAIGERVGVRRKPAPDTVLAAIGELGADPATTVYVGDADTDIETARAAGIACISVTWGYRDHAFLAAHGGTQFADTPGDLLAMLVKEKQ